MGTRHLIVVKNDGKYKIAQYGQWDGYPSGQGRGVLEFLRQEKKHDNFKTFLEKLKLLRFATKRDKEKYENFKKDNEIEGNWITLDEVEIINKQYPLLSRDVGSDILFEVLKLTKRTWLVDDIDFLEDGVFCEWAYFVDFDANVLKVFAGGDNLVKKYSLNKLPTIKRFIKELEECDNEK